MFVTAIISFNTMSLTHIGCQVEMDDDTIKKRCYCPSGVNSNVCVPTDKNYINGPNDCAKCIIKTPIGVSVLYIILSILSIVSLLSWINVFTKTVKF